jgi:hypothetical protein
MRLETGQMVAENLGGTVAYVISQGGVFGTSGKMEDPRKVHATTKLGAAAWMLVEALAGKPKTKSRERSITVHKWGKGQKSRVVIKESPRRKRPALVREGEKREKPSPVLTQEEKTLLILRYVYGPARSSNE